MYLCCGITETGNASHNEDAFLIGRRIVTDGKAEKNLKPPFFAAVCDGVTGEECGELASKMCLEQLRLSRYGAFSVKTFPKKISAIHARLRRYGRWHKNASNMQTTLCALHLAEDGILSFVNVGDSRLYRFRGNELKQLSKDQSLVQLLYEGGSLMPEERRSSSHGHIVLSVMGSEEKEPEPEIKTIGNDFNLGDIYLLCTDGLSDALLDAEIEAVLVLPLSLSQRLDKLVEVAVGKGIRDNITIVAIMKNPF